MHTSALLALLLLAPTVWAQPHYTVRVLCDRQLIYPLGVSPDGVVHGVIVVDGHLDGFSLGKDGFRTVQGADHVSLFVYGANARGTLVGEIGITSGLPSVMLADPGNGIGSISPLGGDRGIAYGIFPDGAIIGSANSPDAQGSYRPFLWHDGIGFELPIPSGATSGGAFGFSRSGFIVGAAEIPGGRVAMRWLHGQSTELGSPSMDGSATAVAVNNQGDAVGYLWTPGETDCYPVLWSVDGATILPTPPSSGHTECQPKAINSKGQIIGEDALGYAPLTWIDGELFDLRDLVVGDLGLTLHYPVGIDDAGRIFIMGYSGPPRSDLIVLLTPVYQCGTADFDFDGISGSDADIQAFFACLAGDCCLLCQSADFNGDGDQGTDADIEGFFRVLTGGSC